jgi:MFS family permease
VTTLTQAVIFMGLLGYPWAVTLTVPFALTAEAAPEEENGVYMGVLNIFVVIPQFMMAAIGPLFVEFWGNDAPQAAFIVGGITSIATLVLIPFLITKKQEEDGVENGEENSENASLKSSSVDLDESDHT